LIIWGIILWRIHNISRVNTELLKLNEELDRFVYSASHDLRAPLSSVMGLVEVAKLESSIEGKDECLSRINDSIHKLDGFINDIIDYSRNQRIDVQADKVDLEFEVTDEELTALKVEKSVMTLIDKRKHHELIEDLDGIKHGKASGGSAANTVACAQVLGAQTYFTCRVGHDASGHFFYDDFHGT